MNNQPESHDPMMRELVAQARKSQLTRRALLGGAGAAAAALALAACSPSGSAKSSGPKAATDTSATDKKLDFSNWSGYMDTDDKGAYPTLEAFGKRTGIKVNYQVAIDDNNTFYGKVKDQLALGKDIGADAVCLTDWMVARWIRLGYTQEFNLSNIPNAKNLNPQLVNVDFDPGRKHSLPWQGGFAGICWNKEAIPGGLKSIDDLWKPELKGRVTVLSEMRDTVGLLLLQAGIDPASQWKETDFDNAIEVLRKQLSSGQIRNIKGNSYLEDLKSGDALAAICWSGDITSLNGEAGNKWEFALPEAGTMIWNDNYLVPIGSSHKTNAEALINYYYDPEVAAQLAAYVQYITPVQGAREVAEKTDPELASNPLIFPSQETLKNAHVFRSLTTAEEQKYQAAFSALALGQ